MIRVMIVDDQQILVEGLSMILALDEEIQVVATANNGEEALDKLLELEVDVVLMDIRMPIMDGVTCTRHIKEKYLCNVLILTTFEDDGHIKEALASGASGYILKDLTKEKLVLAIKSVFEGQMVLNEKISKAIFKSEFKKNDNMEVGLTQREKDVAKLIKEGYSNREIASKLFIAEGTVKNYTSVLYEKYNVKGRMKLIRLLNREGV